MSSTWDYNITIIFLLIIYLQCFPLSSYVNHYSEQILQCNKHGRLIISFNECTYQVWHSFPFHEFFFQLLNLRVGPSNTQNHVNYISHKTTSIISHTNHINYISHKPHQLYLTHNHINYISHKPHQLYLTQTTTSIISHTKPRQLYLTQTTTSIISHTKPRQLYLTLTRI
jgi:hypothetical protein